jgi:hypothetical protein
MSRNVQKKAPSPSKVESSKKTKSTKRISRKKAAALGALGGLALGAAGGLAVLKLKSIKQKKEEDNRTKVYQALIAQYKQDLEKEKKRGLLSIVKSRVKRLSSPKKSTTEMYARYK